MNKKDSLGDRMKENYENRSKTFLTRRTPVILRIDGKAFHSFTKGFQRPYDKLFHKSMNDTVKYLCENIQGCKLGYTQSDEISLLLTDYDTLTTDAWFRYSVQKMCSIAASMATMAFNKSFETNVDWFRIENKLNGISDANTIEWNTYIKYLQARDKGAMFDARCFNIPEDEVVNYFIWRQQDATRNAIQMLGQCNFSHKELQNKTCNDIQNMLLIKKDINFDKYDVEFKRGVCCLKNYVICDVDGNKLANSSVDENKWFIDYNIPIFIQDRDYIDRILEEIREE